MNWEVSNFRHHPRDHRPEITDQRSQSLGLRSRSCSPRQDASGNSLSRDSETTFVAVNDFRSRYSYHIGSDDHVTRFE